MQDPLNKAWKSRVTFESASESKPGADSEPLLKVESALQQATQTNPAAA
jgi:hypothetical protein